MSIRMETDRSGRHVLLTVADDRRSPTALADLLAALRWTHVDEIVVDLSQLDAIDLRVAVVLARATRHHGEIGRRIALVCPSTALAYALRAVGLDRPGLLFPSLAAAGWRGPEARRHLQAQSHDPLDAAAAPETMAGIGT